MSFLPFRPWDAEDRAILGCTFRLFSLSLLVIGNYSPRRGPWILMESGPGPQILWPHNSPSKSCCPDPQTERKVLMTLSLCHSLSILVIYQFQRLFICPRHILGYWKVKHVFIKYRRLCASHVQRRDGNLTVEISLPLWAGKSAQLLLMGGINNL